MKEKKFQIIHPPAAGIDVGASAHYVCVPEDRDASPSGALSASLEISMKWQDGSSLVELKP